MLIPREKFGAWMRYKRTYLVGKDFPGSADGRTFQRAYGFCPFCIFSLCFSSYESKLSLLPCPFPFGSFVLVEPCFNSSSLPLGMRVRTGCICWLWKQTLACRRGTELLPASTVSSVILGHNCSHLSFPPPRGIELLLTYNAFW